MAIDPDMEPILDGITARLSALEAAPAPVGEAVDLGPLTARVVKLEAAFSAMAAALAALADPAQPEPETPAVALPEGYRRTGDFRRARGDAAQWGVDELIMTTWTGGAGTQGDPSLIEWDADGSALLTFVDGAPPRAGVLQLNRPKKASGRWGMIASDIQPGAVAAFFTYASNGLEMDWELCKVAGQPQWLIGIHMPKTGGGRVSSAKVTVPLAAGTHRYEIEHGPAATSFLLDGAEVARFTPADVPGATWDASTAVDVFCSVEHHGGWAGWGAADYAANTAQMRVHALRA